MNTGTFASRHIGPRQQELNHMLNVTGVNTLDELIDQTSASQIRLERPLKLDAPMTERSYLKHLKGLAAKNEIFKTYLGMGYYPTGVPAVIQEMFLRIRDGIRPTRPTKLKLHRADWKRF